MIKQAWVSLLVLGAIIGASAMYSIMYNEPLTDYSVEGIQSYTSIFYGLAPSIFLAINNLFSNILSPIISVIQNIVNVITNLFQWLSTGLSDIIDFFSGWWN